MNYVIKILTNLNGRCGLNEIGREIIHQTNARHIT